MTFTLLLDQLLYYESWIFILTVFEIGMEENKGKTFTVCFSCFKL
jgi:hypothetical protein